MKAKGNKIRIYATAGEMSGEIDLQWNIIKDARSYTIEMKNKANKNWRIVDIINEPHYLIDKLKPRSQYYFRISAINRKGKSSTSNIIQKMVQ